MFTHLVLPKIENPDERKNTNGFTVLSDSSIIKVHPQSVEIFKGGFKAAIEIQEEHSTAEIVELNYPYVALFYPAMMSLTILNIAEEKIVTHKVFDQTIFSLSLLPDNSFLINSKLLCTIKNGEIITYPDNCFNQYHLNLAATDPESKSTLSSNFIPLANKKGFIHYQDSTLTITSNKLKPKATIELQPTFNCLYDKSPPIYITTVVSAQDFLACVTETNYRRYDLHVLSNDLKQAYEVKLALLVPQKLVILNNQYIAVIGDHLTDGFRDNCKIQVKIFDSHCKKIKKFKIAGNLTKNFIVKTSDDELMTCSRTGIRTRHTIFSKEELKKEIKDVLQSKNIPKELIPIISDYTGFFKPTDEKLKSLSYEDARSFWRYLFS